MLQIDQVIQQSHNDPRTDAGANQPVRNLTMLHTFHGQMDHGLQSRLGMRQGGDVVLGGEGRQFAVDLFPRQTHGTDVASDGYAVVRPMQSFLQDVSAVGLDIETHQRCPDRTSRCGLCPTDFVGIQQFKWISIPIVVRQCLFFSSNCGTTAIRSSHRIGPLGRPGRSPGAAWQRLSQALADPVRT